MASQPMILMKPIFNFRLFSRGHGTFNIGEVTEVFGFAFNLDSRMPFAITLIPANTHNARGVVAWHRLVSAIRCIRRLSQVHPSIIVTYVVDMICLICWKFASHIQKSKPMSKIVSVINYDDEVAIRSTMSSNITNLHASSCANQPSKIPGYRIVIKQFLETFLGYNLFRHWLSSLKSMLGGGVLISPRPPIIPDGRL